MMKIAEKESKKLDFGRSRLLKKARYQIHNRLSNGKSHKNNIMLFIFTKKNSGKVLLTFLYIH